MTINATTFGPQAVAAITPSPVYQSMTAAFVATRGNGTLKVSVFRASTSPGGVGLCSRDDYARGVDGRLAKTGKGRTCTRCLHADPRVALADEIDALKALKKDAEAKQAELMGED